MIQALGNSFVLTGILDTRVRKVVYPITYHEGTEMK
jgi:hypothetical protein